MLPIKVQQEFRCTKNGAEEYSRKIVNILLYGIVYLTYYGRNIMEDR